ncbi:MAG: hypothetical protein ACODAQ_08275 [Phycisphaeraceae bacterium]
MTTDDSSTHCTACGYDLSGLGWQGECPECGQHFDRTTGQGVRSARLTDRYERGDRLARRLRTILLAALAATLLACGGASALFTDQWMYPFGTLAVIAAVVALGAVTSFLYEKDQT